MLDRGILLQSGNEAVAHFWRLGVGHINRTGIRCGCGHRVTKKDVIQTGLYLGVFGPNFIYVRYRCGRCKRIGEQLVQEHEWDPSVLRESEPKILPDDLTRFAEMGEITPEEVIDFHYALDRLGGEAEED